MNKRSPVPDLSPGGRYARQLALPEIGPEGQLRLAAGAVLTIGCGGLGSPAAIYLAAAGVGTIGLVDNDTVDVTNLQRQILHTLADVGKPKIESARAKLSALNPELRIVTHQTRFDAGTAPALLKPYDFVIDATDNFASKFLIADACHAAGKPYSHAGILRYTGQTMTVIPGQTACYRCLFESAPPDPSPPVGPLGVVPGVIGAIQATEAIKFLGGFGELLTNRLFVYDALALRARTIPVKRNPACPLCKGSGAITPRTCPGTSSRP
jgi:molybdopterin/thiamine biosynthesis adenylyltransferase